jgi:hypothetical protein
MARTSAPSNPIACTGTDSIYVELHLRRLGAVYELHIVLIEYHHSTGRYDRDELAREIAHDGDEAIDVAADLECLALRRLEERKALGWTDRDFGEAVGTILPRLLPAQALAAE